MSWHIQLHEVKQRSEPDRLLAVGQSYVVLLMNLTDFVVKMCRVNGGTWSATQHIGRTEQSRELIHVPAGTSVHIEVAYEKNGKWWTTGWEPFFADPQYAGGVIQLTQG